MTSMGNRRRSSLRFAFFAAALPGLAWTQAGCSSLSTVTRTTEKPPVGAVSRAAALWSEAILRKDTVPVMQGFAAKVYLFGPESPRPVTSPGKFTIYAYDDSDPVVSRQSGTRAEPDRTWTFSETELRPLLKKDPVGWSYSLWLPYAPPTGDERRVSLRLCFTPPAGRPVLSESALVTLPAFGSKGVQRARDLSENAERSQPTPDRVSLAYRPLEESR